MTSYNRTIAILALSLMSQYPAVAQIKPVAKKEQKQRTAPATPSDRTKAEPSKYLPQKFTMEMIEGERFDNKFSGISLAELISAVEKSASVKKGEFESNSDFLSRKAVALSVKFLGDHSIDETFVVVRSVAAGGAYPRDLSYTYNPDTTDVRIFVLPSKSTLNGIGAPDYQAASREGRGLDRFDFDTKIESKSTYQGSNAYGATVTVEKIIMSGSGIAASQISFLRFKREIFYSNPPSALEFKMDNSKAAKELPILKALVVFKMVEPYTHYDFVHKEPKRDSPTDISMQYKYISSEILGIVYYSGLTGEIFARLPDSFGLPKTSSAADGASAAVDAKMD